MKKLLYTQFPEVSNTALQAAEDAKNVLFGRTGAGAKMTDWLDWPKKFYESEEYSQLLATTYEIRNRDSAVIVIGIGGSYLGARAVIEAELGHYYNDFAYPCIYFAGSDMSTDEMEDIGMLVKDTSFSIVYISKSGGTIEPAIAFRYFYGILRGQYGEKEANRRVIAITGQNGILSNLANKNGWKTFSVPEGIGGRYSVLTPVGMLPISIADISTDWLLEGAIEATKPEAIQMAMQYAAFRYQMEYETDNCKVEFLAVNSKRLQFFGEWYKQLFAESEGKDGKGIFPTSGIFPTDLHSVGQFLQDGTRGLIFETQLIREYNTEIQIPKGDKDDGLDRYRGKTINDAADAAMMGAAIAHSNGGMPVGKIFVDSSTKALGYLLQFMMTACPISGYMHNINPFNQPGVEQHKIAMKQTLSEM